MGGVEGGIVPVGVEVQDVLGGMGGREAARRGGAAAEESAREAVGAGAEGAVDHLGWCDELEDC